jgi:N-acetylneuraminate synthase
MSVARKSLVAIKEIKKGEIFTEANIGIKRPGTGLSPFEYWDLLGKKADKDYMVDEVIA